jgi:hypothetical protein
MEGRTGGRRRQLVGEQRKRAGELPFSIDAGATTHPAERLRVRQRRKSMAGVRRGVGFIALALLFVTGCSTSHKSGLGPAPVPPSTGTVMGTLAVYGGAMTTTSCGCRLEPGVVHLSEGREGEPIAFTVGKSGRFSTRLPAGRYSVEAGTVASLGWPVGSCRLLLIADSPGAAPTEHRFLTVRQGYATHVAIGCAEH